MLLGHRRMLSRAVAAMAGGLLLLSAQVKCVEAQGIASTACWSRIDAVDKGCCSTEEACADPGGVPSMCDDACAATFVPYWNECGLTISAIPGLPLDGWNTFFETCMQTVGSDTTLESCEETMQQLDDVTRQNEDLRRQLSMLVSSRCCEESEWSDEARGQGDGSAVCGFTPGNRGTCQPPTSWDTGMNICLSLGGRLCNLAELLIGEARATGCGYDNAPLVWSSSTGNCPAGTALAGPSCGGDNWCAVPTDPTDPDSDVSQCVAVETALPVRCCADYCAGAVPGLPPPPPTAIELGDPPRLPADPSIGTQYGMDRDARRAPAPPPGARNVMMIVIDDWRPEMHAFGDTPYGIPPYTGIQTPNLDAFARSAATFRSAYVQEAICGASRASFLTGRRVETTRVYFLSEYFREVGGDFVTVPQHFAEHGYSTSGMGKIFHPSCTGQQAASAGGCDPLSWTEPYFKSPEESRYTCSLDAEAHGHCTHMPSHYAVPAAEEAAHPLPDTQIKDQAVATLAAYQQASARGEQTRQIFTAVGFHKPHLPFVVPQRFVDLYPIDSIAAAPNRFAPDRMPLVAWSNSGELFSWADALALGDSGQVDLSNSNGIRPNASFPIEFERELRQHYYACVTYMDHNVGELLAANDGDPSTRESIIVMFGDHGWQLGEHGEFAKHTNFDIATKTPLILRVPGVTDTPGFGGRHIEGYVELVDVFPTLAELAGLPIPSTCPADEACMTSGVAMGCASASTEIRACTEGASLQPLLDCYAQGGGAPCDMSHTKAAAFSVYPHYGSNEWHQALGLSMTTRDAAGVEWRYTEWVPFDADADWTMAGYNPSRFDMVMQQSHWCNDRNHCLAAKELYNHATDPQENANVVDFEPQVAAVMRAQLHAGWRGAFDYAAPAGSGSPLGKDRGGNHR